LTEGDEILAINGQRVSDWDTLRQTLASSLGRDSGGNPRIVISLERDGQPLELEVFPRVAGPDRLRTIGVAPAERVVIRATAENSPARLAGLGMGDRIISAGGESVDSIPDLNDIVEKHLDRDLPLTFERGSEILEVTVRPVSVPYTTDGRTMSSIGISEYVQTMTLSHPTPFRQMKETVTLIQRTLTALVHPQSDLTLGHLSGPPGIVRVIWITSQIDIRYVLWFVVVINLNFAIFNLLPIPVLDGGHILFATIGKLRGRALPMNLIATVQGAFMILLLSLMLFVSFKDVTRWTREERDEMDIRETYVKPVFKLSTSD
jgi:regulator of sigma E protease